MTLSANEFESRLAQALVGDRMRLRRRFESLARRTDRAPDRTPPQHGNPARDRRRPDVSHDSWDRLLHDLDRSVARREDRRRSIPTLTYDPALPIAARRDEIAQVVREHPVVIVCGETGSGKSTQIPKILLELGRGTAGLIGHTQPRRIAARSVAARIAEEIGSPLGDLVGFQVRFADATSQRTLVKVMTDGILLAETEGDRFLERYDTLVIDEAHERSLNIDFLLGYVRRLLDRRDDLKLVVTSATLDAARFAAHFGTPQRPAPVIEVAGRTYPVEVRYRPPAEEEEADSRFDSGERLRSVTEAIDEIARTERGDVLVFLPTERDILEAARVLRSRYGSSGALPTEILPLYGRLPTSEQQKLFAPHAARRIVLATNVAESSLTVPGIRAVVDTGTARISRYSARSKVQRLPIEPVSQASADQRKGRCGRLGPGICVRLYAEADFLARDRFTPPEIQRTNLAGVILQTKSLRLGPIEEFPFLDPPKPTTIRDGYRTLFELGALDDSQELTPIGRRLARWPVDPRIGRMILAAAENRCLADVLIVAAALEVQDPRDRPLDKQQAADEAHARFADADSDFVALLKLWDFQHALREELSNNRFREACRRHFLSYNRLREWSEVHRQFVELVERGFAEDVASGSVQRGGEARGSGPQQPGGANPRGRPQHDRGRTEGRDRNRGPAQQSAARATQAPGSSADRGASNGKEGERGAAATTTAGFAHRRLGPRSNDYEAIHKSLLAGLLSNIAQKNEAGEYVAADGQKFHLWPGSGTLAKKPQWIVAAELVETTRRYLRTVARVQPEWIEPLAGHLVTRTHASPRWSRERAAVLADERVTLFGLAIVPRRTVQFGRIDPVAARAIFLREGLVPGEIDTRGTFRDHNLLLLEQLHEEQAKSRQADLLRGEEARYEFYDARVPDDVCDGRTFERWRKEAEKERPTLLHMERRDLLVDPDGGIAEQDFPSVLQLERMNLPLEYRLEPGAARDGITVVLPREALNQFRPERLGWLVPGLLEQKIVALIKSLPKPLRTQYVPAQDTARAVLAELRFGEGDLLAEVARILSRIGRQHVTPADFDADRLPAHLRMNVRVIDAEGSELAAGRDLGEIRRELGASATQEFSAAQDPRWTRDGIVEWDFGELPERIDVPRRDLVLAGHPTLLDRGESVSLRLLDVPERAAWEHRFGLRRLFVLAARRELKAQVDWFPQIDRLVLSAASIPGCDLRRELTDLLADRAWFDPVVPLPRTAEQFRQQLLAGRNRLNVVVQDVAAWLGPLLGTRQELRAALAANRPPAWRESVLDMQVQLDALFPADFLSRTPREWLAHFPRYLQGMQVRLQKLAGAGLARDVQHARSMRSKWEAWLERRARHAAADFFDPRLIEFRWWLEEFRISLFAQTLRTAIPISEKRLSALAAEIRDPG